MASTAPFTCPNCKKTKLLPSDYHRTLCPACISVVSGPKPAQFPPVLQVKASPSTSGRKLVAAESHAIRRGVSPRTIVKIVLLVAFLIWPVATLGIAALTYSGMREEAISMGHGRYSLNGAVETDGSMVTSSLIAGSCCTTPIAFFVLGSLAILVVIVPGHHVR